MLGRWMNDVVGSGLATVTTEVQCNETHLFQGLRLTSPGPVLPFGTAKTYQNLIKIQKELVCFTPGLLFFTPWSHFFESRLFGVTPIRRDSRLFGEDSRLFGEIHAYSARFTSIRRLNRCDSKKTKFHAYSAKIHAYSARCCLRGLDITET